MSLYITVIALCNIIIVMVNVWFGFTELSLFETAVSSLMGTVAVIAVDGITAFAVRKLPQRLFSPKKRLLGATKGERNLYRKFGIRHWKDRVPELGGFTGFHKDKVESRTDGEYLGRFLLESNYGVVIHIVNAVFGYLIILFPFCNELSIGIPVAFVNMVLSIMPAMVLRYNIPTLAHLYKKSFKALRSSV